jgi:CRISPR-associated endonuclease/helicase Cas3
VLVIRNTVNGALELQEEIEKMAGDKAEHLFTCNGVPTLHHSRFAREDRGSLDKVLEERFGRSPRLPGGCVVVATQTVQQSLDLDADFLISDLCPMDVLLQRIGRLHRHKRDANNRPPAYAKPCAVVLVPEERDMTGLICNRGEAQGPHGLGTVYRDMRILEATWKLLEEHSLFDIPSMNRKLVESAMHSTVLSEVVKEKGEAWERHRNKIWGETSNGTKNLENMVLGMFP